MSRYCLIPTFGKDTIRRFTENTSKLKHMAARNFEDFLQASVPFSALCYGFLTHIDCHSCF
jgi:hypothetical protein